MDTANNLTYGLKNEVIEQIKQVFAQFNDISSVILYGSRAKGNYRNGSDIDITIHTQGERNNKLLYDVMGALDDLDLPYGFDVSLYTHLDNDSLKEHINRVGIEFYNAQQYRQRQLAQAKRQQYQQQAIESEAKLEKNLIKRLISMGYQAVTLDNSDALKANLQQQLEKHNEKSLQGNKLTTSEFAKVLNHLDKGNVFQRAKTLRDRMELTRDDGSSCYIQFLNTQHWCQNQYQVTSQVTVIGKYENRYDVTLLINGLPLVQIELKRRGIELKEAFNQINRYQRHSYWADNGLFNYVQLFVISNGVNSKYYANNRKQDFKQTFYWADENNQLITALDEFTDVFLEKCHISKMISKYIVLHESDKILMALRPYQYYAVEAIVERVKQGRKHGYIWHTTGSGKTLTSFKTAQILTEDISKVDKVLFVVDRADLDYQTTKEFNAFSDGCVDGTNNTKSLVTQMSGDNKLIVTTIQKLNSAISKPRHEQAMQALKDKRIVFIFDECHRSQFGDTHKAIVNFFSKVQMFGFTGTPIFAENATVNEHGKRTTKDLFSQCLHKYLITNAISDDNVLKFSIEYYGKITRKISTNDDEQVNTINTKEIFESDKHINEVTNWVIKNHTRKTHNLQFSAMMCVSSKEMLIKYYEAFKQKQLAGEHNLRIVTIFSYGANDPDSEANGLIGEPDFDIKTDAVNADSREKLEAYVKDYNQLYKTEHSVKDSTAFYSYYKDIAKRIKERDKENFQDKDRVDILLVVNMFLTGFDAKKLNTLYVDKNLKYHGLIQAYSRTNRILGELKSQGNIVCFRNLKENTDKAIKLFCDTNASEDVLMEPYEFYVAEFNQGVSHLLTLAETPQAVDALISEDAQLAFVKAFRFLIRTLNKLKPFTDFSWQDLSLSAQQFEDYKSKYLDIYDRTHNSVDEGVSIIDEVDFSLELIHRDEINVAYILKLLGDLQQKQQDKKATTADKKAQQAIIDLLNNEPKLRSKRDLIEKFIQQYMPKIKETENIEEVFVDFWRTEKQQAINELCEQEQLQKELLYKLLDDYRFSGKEPLREQIFAALNYRPKLMDRKKVYTRILAAIKNLINRYEDNTGLLTSTGEVIGEERADYQS